MGWNDQSSYLFPSLQKTFSGKAGGKLGSKANDTLTSLTLYTTCIDRLRITAQYRAWIPQIRTDTCRIFSLAFSLRSLWLVHGMRSSRDFVTIVRNCVCMGIVYVWLWLLLTTKPRLKTCNKNVQIVCSRIILKSTFKPVLHTTDQVKLRNAWIPTCDRM